MFYISRSAAESGEVRDSIEDKISIQSNLREKEFLDLLFPAIENLLSQYDGMCGVTIAGEVGEKRANLAITAYTNEIGE